MTALRQRMQEDLRLRNFFDISALQMTMKEADLWDHIAKLYRPLPVPKTRVRQNMSEGRIVRTGGGIRS